MFPGRGLGRPRGPAPICRNVTVAGAPQPPAPAHADWGPQPPLVDFSTMAGVLRVCAGARLTLRGVAVTRVRYGPGAGPEFVTGEGPASEVAFRDVIWRSHVCLPQEAGGDGSVGASPAPEAADARAPPLAPAPQETPWRPGDILRAAAAAAPSPPPPPPPSEPQNASDDEAAPPPSPPSPSLSPAGAAAARSDVRTRHVTLRVCLAAAAECFSSGLRVDSGRILVEPPLQDIAAADRPKSGDGSHGRARAAAGDGAGGDGGAGAGAYTWLLADVTRVCGRTVSAECLAAESAAACYDRECERGPPPPSAPGDLSRPLACLICASPSHELSRLARRRSRVCTTSRSLLSPSTGPRLHTHPRHPKT